MNVLKDCWSRCNSEGKVSILVQALMCVDGHQFHTLIVKLDLLVRSCEVQLGELLTTGQASHEICWLWKWILVHLESRIYCDLIVTTNPYGPILLGHRYDWCSPIRVINSTKDTTLLQPIQLLTHLLLNGKRYWSCSAEARPCTLLESQLCLDTFQGSGS